MGLALNQRVPNTVSPAQHDVEPGLQLAGCGQDLTSQGLPSQAFTPSRGRSATIVPLAPELYKVQFTASAETCKKLRLAQDLLRHQIPDGDPAAIFDRALTALLKDLVRKKIAATDRPREIRERIPGSRHIPAEVKRVVWLRDGGRCAFVGQNGRRCTEQGFLEYHHVTPYASGGPPTVDNTQLRCRAHNGYEAELEFGPRNPSVVREPRAPYLNPGRAGAPQFAARPGATRSGPSALLNSPCYRTAREQVKVMRLAVVRSCSSPEAGRLMQQPLDVLATVAGEIAASMKCALLGQHDFFKQRYRP